MRRLIIFICCILMRHGAEGKFFSTTIARQRLLNDLLANYDPASKPAPTKTVIKIEVNISITSFQFRERDEAFHIFGILHLFWYDPKLGWNPIDYNNITKIPINQRAVWVPDMEFYNNSPDKFLRMHRNGMVVVTHTGAMQWSDTIEVTVFCTAEMKNWPHDQHSCTLRLGSWAYDGFEVDFAHTDYNATLTFENFHNNTEYRIAKFVGSRVSTTYNCCPEPYVTIDYNISFERRSAFVVVFRAAAFATILLSLLATATADSTSKILLNGFAMLLIVSNLIYFANKVGSFARTTPLIVRFYNCSFWLIMLSHTVTTFSLLTTRSMVKFILPNRLLRFLQHPWVAWMAPNRVRRTLEFEASKLIENSDRSHNDWICFTKFLERIALIVITSSYLILGSIYCV